MQFTSNSLDFVSLFTGVVVKFACIIFFTILSFLDSHPSCSFNHRCVLFITFFVLTVISDLIDFHFERRRSGDEIFCRQHSEEIIKRMNISDEFYWDYNWKLWRGTMWLDGVTSMLSSNGDLPVCDCSYWAKSEWDSGFSDSNAESYGKKWSKLKVPFFFCGESSSGFFNYLKKKPDSKANAIANLKTKIQFINRPRKKEEEIIRHNVVRSFQNLIVQPLARLLFPLYLCLSSKPNTASGKHSRVIG